MKRRKPRWDPLANWDGVAYHHDGVTPVDLVKTEILDLEMRVFDTLPKKTRDMLNHHGGMALEEAGY